MNTTPLSPSDEKLVRVLRAHHALELQALQAEGMPAPPALDQAARDDDAADVGPGTRLARAGQVDELMRGVAAWAAPLLDMAGLNPDRAEAFVEHVRQSLD